MTEEEAKKKWCPMIKVHTFGYGQDEHYSNNRLELANLAKCISTGCMAWRAYPTVESNGYCGLAGKP